MGKFDLIVFDMAGTTVLDKGNVADAFIGAFREQGITIPRNEVKKVMGWRKIDAITRLLKQFAPDRSEAPDAEALIHSIHDSFIKAMIAFYANDAELSAQPHAEELFHRLKEEGMQIALNTGFTRSITNTILDRLNWQEGKELDAVICSDEVPKGRPHPDMIRTLMDKLFISDPSRVVKVGDTEVDVEEGRNADCGLVISVTTGAYSRQQLEGAKPDYIIDSLAELPALMA